MRRNKPTGLLEIPSTDFNREFSPCCDAARGEPVLVTKYGRPEFVLMAFSQYQNLINRTGPTASGPPTQSTPHSNEAARPIEI